MKTTLTTSPPPVGREFIRQQLEPHMAAIAAKGIELALGAKKTVFASHEGAFTDERQVEDHDATLRAQDQVHRLLGNYAPSKATSDGPRTIVIKRAVFNLGGEQGVTERIIHALGVTSKVLEAPKARISAKTKGNIMAKKAMAQRVETKRQVRDNKGVTHGAS